MLIDAHTVHYQWKLPHLCQLLKHIGRFRDHSHWGKEKEIFTDRIQSMGEGNVFIDVCQSVHGGRVHPGYTPSSGCTPLRPPHQKTDGQQVVGTYPTGMHTCLKDTFHLCRHLIKTNVWCAEFPREPPESDVVKIRPRSVWISRN